MKDSHVHTTISHDGKSSMQEYINCLDEKKVDEITFTEHYDIYDGIQTNLQTLDVDNYYRCFKKMEEIAGDKINFGIEIGLQPDVVEIVKDMVSRYAFDFIIGSSHITCKKDISMDPSFFEGLTRRESYLKYFKEVLENIKLYDEFDVYGHLDYIVRYGGYDLKRIDYGEFRDILDEILISIIKKDKGIEINTSGIKYKLGSVHPNFDIIKRYLDLGGKIITVGSDAHRVGELAGNFDIAYDMLESLRVKEVAVYHKRIPDFVSIKQLRK